MATSVCWFVKRLNSKLLLILAAAIPTLDFKDFNFDRHSETQRSTVKTQSTTELVEEVFFLCESPFKSPWFSV